MTRNRVRAGTVERGYGSEHKALRAWWKPHVDAGEVHCHALRHVDDCLARDTWLDPDLPWDLGHTQDRSAWTGPEYRGCNRADGARRRYAPRLARRLIL